MKLRALKIGGKLYGTPEDVTAFIDAQNPTVEADGGEGERTPETERRLQRAGLL